MKTALCTVAVLAGVLAVSAHADGLPVLGIDVGAKGVVASGTDRRYVTALVGRDTLVARVDRRSGRVRRRGRRARLRVDHLARRDGAGEDAASRSSITLNAEIRKIMARPDVKEAWAQAGRQSDDHDAARIRQVSARRHRKWAKVVSAAGIGADRQWAKLAAAEGELRATRRPRRSCGTSRP